jgi:hypothetical protein
MPPKSRTAKKKAAAIAAASTTVATTTRIASSASIESTIASHPFASPEPNNYDDTKRSLPSTGPIAKQRPSSSSHALIASTSSKSSSRAVSQQQIAIWIRTAHEIVPPIIPLYLSSFPNIQRQQYVPTVSAYCWQRQRGCEYFTRANNPLTKVHKLGTTTPPAPPPGQ